MKARCVVATVNVLAFTLLVAGAVAGQSAKWTPAAHGRRQARHPGHVHVQPRSRRCSGPTALAGKDVLTAEEAAAFEASENKRLNRDLFDPEKGAPSAGYAPRSQGGVLSYNEFWYERGNQLTEDRRTSLIIDPPDGRIPFTAATRARNGGAGGADQRRVFDDSRGSQPRRPLHPRLQLRAADDLGHVQQQPADRSDARLRRHLQRDGPQRADHPDRRSSARHAPAVDRRFARPLGGRHARGRDASTSGARPACPARRAETQLVERFTRVDSDTIDYRVHRHGPDDVHAALDAR